MVVFTYYKGQSQLELFVSRSRVLQIASQQRLVQHFHIFSEDFSTFETIHQKVKSLHAVHSRG